MSIDTAGFWCGEGDGNRCGYCHSINTSFSTGIYLNFTTPHRYNALIDRGWRRSGQYMYKPSMQKTCCPLYTIKCDALQFRPTRSQKKSVKRFVDFLKSSSPGSVPSKRQCVRADGTVNDRNDFTVVHGQDNSTDGIKIERSTESGISNGSSHSSESNQSKSTSNSQPRISTDNSQQPRTYKTGAQLAASSKKRDFRRLRKLKKIALSRNVQWETLDVRELGSESPPMSLAERLSPALSNQRLQLKLVKIEPGRADSPYQETFAASAALFQKYQMSIHKDTEDDSDETHFKRFLCSPPFQDDSGTDELGGYHHQYYLDGKLIAVGVLDFLPRCVSSVYFYYDPAYGALSLGTLSALFEVELTQQLNRTRSDLRWYYMGYYIHTCQKMRYKSRFSPSYLLCPRAYTWWPISHCTPILEVDKYCEFSTAAEGERAPEESITEAQLDTLKVLHGHGLLMYSRYRTISTDTQYRDVLIQLVKLVGLENAQNICVYTR